MSSICGIDFGTSNSTIGLVEHGRPVLVPLENGQVAMPSALFFNFDEYHTHFGREAINDYIDGEFGRLMRSLKSILGTSLMNQATHLGQRNVSYSEIIAEFLCELKKRAESYIGDALTQVVAGRPVHFVDGDKSADNQAQQALSEIYHTVGFQDVEFQFEPIAAAIKYEQQLEKEELVLVVDIGGGTSDFTIIRLSPQQKDKADRYDDILATTGVHIGGNDFDRRFNLYKAMPNLGLHSKVQGTSTQLEMPTTPYFDLATWHLIHKQYDQKKIFNIQQLKLHAEQPELLARLLKVLKQQDGHRLISRIEECKIQLAENNEAQLDLDFIEDNLLLSCTQSEFEEATKKEIENISETIELTLKLSQIKSEKVNSIFLTGGTTALPAIRRVVNLLFPHSSVVEGDRFGSVGAGLVYDGMRRFG